MFKNLNQLKKNLKVGQKVIVRNYLKDYEEEREVIQVKSNGLVTGKEIDFKEYAKRMNTYLKYSTIRTDDDKFYETRTLDFQKAKHTKFTDKAMQLIAYTDDRDILIPSLDFKNGEVWLELEFV